MTAEKITLSGDELQALLASDDASIYAYFESLAYPADIKDFIVSAQPDRWSHLLHLVEDPEVRAAVVSEIDESDFARLLSQLSAAEIAGLVREMESDDAADFIAKIPLELRTEALRQLSPDERRQIQLLLHYPEDSAGGIMQVERAQVRIDATVKDAIVTVRELVEEDVEVLMVWVVDIGGRLTGSVALVDLLLNKSTTPIAQLVDRDVVSVQPWVDQEKVGVLFKKYDLLAVPVIDEDGYLLGRIVIDDVVDVMAEEAEEDALHMGGTSAEELIRPDAVWATASIRLPWLAVSLVCSVLSGLVLGCFSRVIQSADMLLVFLPVITAMGGNVGTQSATILIRGFSTEKIDVSNIPAFVFKEMRVGLVLGAVYGVITGIFAWITVGHLHMYLGVVVFIAMCLAMMTAATLGVVAPSVLKRLGIDPAIASGPFVTTVSDITGILIYMSTAYFFLTQFAP